MSENRIRGTLSSKKGMLGQLNKQVLPIVYEGDITDTIKVIVDNKTKKISAQLIGGSVAGAGSVRFDVIQKLDDIQKERARKNIGAVEANKSIPSSTEHVLVRYDSKGLVVDGRKIDKDDLPNKLNGVTFVGETTFDKDVQFNANIIQKGATYELHGTKIYSKNDYIFMREGATRGLSDNEYTGLVASDYDGDGSYGALIYDRNGIARVGDIEFKWEVVNPKPKDYEKAKGYYYLDELGRYISIADDTVTPEFYETIDKVYKNSVVSSNTQAIATRLEEGDENLVDTKLVIWDEKNHILTAPYFEYNQTKDTSEPSADDGQFTYISSIEVDQNGRVSKTNQRTSTIKKSWRPVKVNDREFLIATDGKTINFKDGSSIIIEETTSSGEVKISINNKIVANQANGTDALQFLYYNTEGIVTGVKETAKRKKVKLSTTSAEKLLSTVYGIDDVDLILYGPERQVSTSDLKRYILGSALTSDMANTDTNSKVFMQSGKLHSNNSEVVNLADDQAITGVKHLKNGLKFTANNKLEVISSTGTPVTTIDINTDGSTTFNQNIQLKQNQIKTSAGNTLSFSDENAHIASTNTEQEITGKKTISGETVINHNIDVSTDNQFNIGASDKRLNTIYAVEFNGNSTSSDKVNHTLKYQSGVNETQEYDGSIARDLTDKVVDVFKDQTINGKKTFNHLVTMNEGTDVTGAVNINGDLHITGDIVQEGSAYETHAEHLYTSKDVLITRDGATKALASDEYSGVVAQKYDGTNDGGLIFDNAGVARVGDIIYNAETGKIEITDTQPLATREEAPVDTALAIWDKNTNRFVTDSHIKVVNSKLLYNDSEVVNLADDQVLTGHKKFNGNVTLNSDVFTDVDEAVDLGTADKKFGTIYANTFSGNATSADKVNHTLSYYKNATEKEQYNGSADRDIGDKVVNLFNDQDIAGVKTFNDDIILANTKTLKGKLANGTLANIFNISASNNATFGGAGIGYVAFYNNIQPSSANNGVINIGSQLSLWKDIYLSGSLKDNTYSVTVANIVDKNTAQTITGKKTFSNVENTYGVNYVNNDQIRPILIGNNDTNLQSLRAAKDFGYNAGNNTLYTTNIKVSGNVTDGSNTKTVKQIVDTVNKVDTMEVSAQENRIETITVNKEVITIDANKNVDIPEASDTNFGVIKLESGTGIWKNSNGALYVAKATNEEIAALKNNYKAIVPSNLTVAVRTVGDPIYVDFTSDQTISGKKTFSNTIVGNSGAIISGDLTVSGNIYQEGETYETHSQKVYSTNDYIYLREGAKSALTDNKYTGLEFINYDGTNNGRLVVDNKGIARVGDVGDEQPLATREETPLTNGYAQWDETNSRFKTISVETLRANVGTNVTANSNALQFVSYNKDGFITGNIKTVYNKVISINGVNRNVITDQDSNLTPFYAPENAGNMDGDIVMWDAETGKPKWGTSASSVVVIDNLNADVFQDGQALSAHQGYVLDNKKVDIENINTIEGTQYVQAIKYLNNKLIHIMSSEQDDTKSNLVWINVSPLSVDTNALINISNPDATISFNTSEGVRSTYINSSTNDGIIYYNAKLHNLRGDSSETGLQIDAINKNVAPEVESDNFNLGKTGSRFNNLYLKGKLTDNTNSFTVAEALEAMSTEWCV